MTAPFWQLVLYGRTARADRWWRVRPRAADLDWLNDVVTTTTVGGEGLDAGPRFVLARRRGQTLVGGASRAALLSDAMNSDGSRPFYTFVGWFSDDPDVTVPDLETVEARWSTWASEEYQAWMPLDWNRHQSDLPRAHEPPIRRPPWSDENAAHAGTPQEATQGSTPALDDSFPDTAATTRSVQWRRAAGIVGDVQLVVGPATVEAAKAEHPAQQSPSGPPSSDAPPAPGSQHAVPWPPEADTNPTSPPTERGWPPPPTTSAAASSPARSSPPPAPSPSGSPGPRPNRLQRKIKQFITGINEDTVEAPPAESRIPMANDLEYLRLQEQRKGAKPRPAKHPGPPPDARDR